MAKVPGLAIYHGESETMESDGTPVPGDAVAVAGGQVTTADGTNDTNVIGVVSDTTDPDHAAGDSISVQTGGTVVAAVTDGVVSGDDLGASATEGMLTAGSGAGTAFSDQGGEYQGDIPKGYAAVRLGGVN